MNKNYLCGMKHVVAIALFFCLNPISGGKYSLIPQKSIFADGIEIREVFIPMQDGKFLAADLYLPEKMNSKERFPILLEYLPYRKDEMRQSRFALFSYFVKRGYIVAKVDIRGTGRSQGKLIQYEYSEQEQKDGEEVISWLAKHPNSMGMIGMLGISWGGFNSLHMAMRNPPALKAIISLMSTDDIYEDDVHFIDGMMHVDAYEMRQDIDNAIPGPPDFLIDEEYFANRFDTEPWMLQYKKQPKDGSFWDRASLNANYDAIQIPVFMIGGWYDGYRDAVPRVLSNLTVPVKAMLGPWNHTMPNWAEPEPAIEWRNEAVRWFDYWLKGENTGIMDEPMFAVFMRKGHPPGTKLDSIPGSWQWEKGWPVEHIENEKWYFLIDSSLSIDNFRNGEMKLQYKPSAGIEASGSVMWWGDWAPDQKNTDQSCLTFDSPVIQEEKRILGFPTVKLNVSASAELANWIVRLEDISPENEVTLITGAGKNGAHRFSAENPEMLTPNEKVALEIEMHFASWTFKTGHKIRVSVNNALWPMIWPTPHSMTTTLYLDEHDGSFLYLPVDTLTRHNSPEFLNPESDPQLTAYENMASETLSGYAEVSDIFRDSINQITKVEATHSGSDVFPWGKQEFHDYILHQTSDVEPAFTSVISDYSTTIYLKNRILKWQGLLTFKSDRTHFHYNYKRLLFENDKLIKEKNWVEKIPRDHQ